LFKGRVSGGSAAISLTDKSGQILFRQEALPPLSALEGEWRQLEAAGSPSFFTSWHWIGTLLAAVPSMSRPRLLRGSVGGETVALALLGARQSRRRCGLVRSRAVYLNQTGDPHFDSPMIEHNGILTAAGYERASWQALLAWFTELRDGADELHISGSLWRWPEQELASHGLACNADAVPSYVVELCRLRDSEGEPYPLLSANARQQLRRAVRDYEQIAPLRLAEAGTLEEAQNFFFAMKALHCASWERRGKPHAFSGRFFEPFHRLLIERSFSEGGTQLLRASAGDHVIGYLYNFRLGCRIYAYQSGFADSDRRKRPGFVTHALAIGHAFRSGATVYDFMAGRNQLKASFATRCEPMLWQIVQQPRLAFRLENFGRRLKQALGRTVPSARKDLPGRDRNVTAAETSCSPHP
jgi:CelD/BcsL family acetyltransferase involved in cellulose biosynthesis